MPGISEGVTLEGTGITVLSFDNYNREKVSEAIKNQIHGIKSSGYQLKLLAEFR